MNKKKEFYKLHSELCKTLAHPKRQEILDVLRKRELTVGELVNKTRISQANLSQHLSMLKSQGVVFVRRDGLKVYYRISNGKILKAFDLISEVLFETLDSQNKTVRQAIGGKIKQERP